MKRNIIKSMLTLCGVLFALGASADGLYISNFNALPNTATTVSVKMKNTNVISGYQFDLVLPAGVTLNSATASNARTSFTYNITKKSMSDGSIRILCMASGAANATFTGTDGEVMKLSLTSTSTGNKTLTIKNQVITESDLDELEPANATATMHVHALTATAAKSATCETAGNKAYWTCSGCNKVYSNNTATTETTVANMTIAALGHSYGTATWAWTGYTAATVSKTCSHDSSHKLTATATITNAVTTAATCTNTGIRTYTANATLDGTSLSDTKTETIAAKGHNYGEAVWTWNGLTSASAKITCANDPKHVISGNATITNAVTTPATDTTDGIRTYTAKVTLNNKEYTDQKTETIQAKGHTYGAPTWAWTGTSAAKAVFECTQKDDTQEVNATITNAITKQPTCEEAGERTYTATVTFNNLQYTDTKTETIAAKGHSYGEAVWIWNGLTAASAKITCANDPNHIVEANANITSSIKTPATCTAKGTTTYTAKVTLAGKEYTDSKDAEDIEEINHTLSCIDNNDGTHTISCDVCSYSVTEAHKYIDGTCTECGNIENVDTDVSKYEDIIYIEKENVCIGNTTKLSIKMKNTGSISGYEFELALPEGFSIPETVDEYGDKKLNVYLSTERTNATRTNNFMSSILPNGNLKVICYSSNGYAFAGNDGEIAKVEIKLTREVAEDDYTLQLLGCVSSNASKTYYLPDVKTTVKAITYTLGDANSDGFINVGDLTAIASHILGATPEKFITGAADANTDTFINVGDLTFIANMILTGNVNKSKTNHLAQKESPSADIIIKPSKLTIGETVCIPASIRTNEKCSGFQYDINIPDGLELISIYPSSEVERLSDYFNVAEISKGVYRVLCYSLSDKNIIGYGDDIINILVASEKGTKDGEYSISINNAFTSNSYVTIATKPSNSVVYVSAPTRIDELFSDNESLDVYGTNGVIIKRNATAKELRLLKKGLYIINGKKIIK